MIFGFFFISFEFRFRFPFNIVFPSVNFIQQITSEFICFIFILFYNIIFTFSFMSLHWNILFFSSDLAFMFIRILFSVRRLFESILQYLPCTNNKQFLLSFFHVDNFVVFAEFISVSFYYKKSWFFSSVHKFDSRLCLFVCFLLCAPDWILTINRFGRKNCLLYMTLFYNDDIRNERRSVQLWPIGLFSLHIKSINFVHSFVFFSHCEITNWTLYLQELFVYFKC